MPMQTIDLSHLDDGINRGHLRALLATYGDRLDVRVDTLGRDVDGGLLGLLWLEGQDVTHWIDAMWTSRFAATIDDVMALAADYLGERETWSR